MSRGENRVRLDFNPSNNSLVDEIKSRTAELIDLCDREISGPEEARLWDFGTAALRGRCHVGCEGRDNQPGQ